MNSPEITPYGLVGFTPEMAHAAATRGAAWLDEKCPDWLAHITLESLNLGSATCCVLGQTADCLVPDRQSIRYGFFRVVDCLGLDPTWVDEHGFDAPGGVPWQYEMLTIAWSELIRERLAVPA